jgi:short-subunit dehydrogenase
MIQVFSPLLIASKGTIINISSVAAYVPTPFLSAYNGTKASLTMMSNTLRYEMEPFGVKVIVVSQNGYQTPIQYLNDFAINPC